MHGPGVDTGTRLRVLDVVRGLTILWVTVMHLAADTTGLPGADVSPAAIWAALADGRPLDAALRVMRGVLCLPGFRLDVLLVLTGIVLGLGRPRPAATLWAQRARAILPGYWMGTLLVTAVIIACAAVRATVLDESLDAQLHHGSRLAGAPYPFAFADVLVGLSLFGRFLHPSLVQVVSPSLWYVALVAQFYALYPVLRWASDRLGATRFLVVCGAITIGARALIVSAGMVPGHVDVSSVLASLLPFRLLSPAIGMAMAPWVREHAARVQPWLGSTALLPVAIGLLLTAGWVGSGLLPLSGVAMLVGPSLAVVPAIAGLMTIGAWALTVVPPVGEALVRLGRRSLALLVVQDALRFTVGTLLSLGVPVATWSPLWVPVYLGVAWALSYQWAPLVDGVTHGCLGPRS